MSKKIIWVLALILLAALGAALWLLYTSRGIAPAPSNQGGIIPNTSSPVSPSQPIPTPSTSTNSFPVATESGSTLIVQDFTTTSKLLPGETKSYELEQTPAFAIEYSGLDQSFVIGLNLPPFPATRQAAEAAFLQKLNISKQQACALKVVVSIPGWASDNATGIDYGLSFCPFALPVPEN